MRNYDQKMAEKAFECVFPQKDDKEYRSFALNFPALVHSCGLVQAVAFAESRNRVYVDHLAAVFGVVEPNVDLSVASRTADVVKYMRLSRRALSAASWLKCYVQAFDNDSKEQ
ncbi:MAG: type III-B CRISPR module-associated protein Cmr5 [Synergistaceae bacterium]|jgi:CRISPR/Cas system CMR-associated protein Cmr5 small subunit|nr:type III-B CRISPR module-associated protein Cmr5 [Synergistaceae bacterium]